MFFKICGACHKRKFYTRKPWIKIANIPAIRPKEPLCTKCLPVNKTKWLSALKQTIK